MFPNFRGYLDPRLFGEMLARLAALPAPGGYGGQHPISQSASFREAGSEECCRIGPAQAVTGSRPGAGRSETGLTEHERGQTWSRRRKTVALGCNLCYSVPAQRPFQEWNPSCMRLVAAIALCAVDWPLLQAQSIQQFFEDFTAEWVRGDPNLASRTTCFKGEQLGDRYSLKREEPCDQVSLPWRP